MEATLFSGSLVFAVLVIVAIVAMAISNGLSKFDAFKRDMKNFTVEGETLVFGN